MLDCAPFARMVVVGRCPRPCPVHLVLSLPPPPAAPLAGADVPSLARLVAEAGDARLEPRGRDASLAAFAGLAFDADAPIAALLLRALGDDPQARYWLRATPVHLEASRDDVRLAGAVRDLDVAEAAALTAALDAHFAPDGLCFRAPRAHAWFVDIGRHVPPVTRALPLALDRPLRGLLPADTPGAPWRRWLHEIEMLLAAHPANAARERAGRASVNALWLMQGGRIAPVKGDALAIWGDDDAALALGMLARESARTVPADLAPVLDAGASRAIVALPSSHAWPEVDSRWLTPARHALRTGRLGRLTLLVERRDGAAVSWDSARPSLPSRLAHALRRPSLTAFNAALESEP